MYNSDVAKQKIIVVVGPTSSGKSDLAVEIALRLRSGQALRLRSGQAKLRQGQAKKQFGIKGAEIISADSRQVYKGMSIGSGKITKKEMRGIPHHLLNVISPKGSPAGGFTVARFKHLAQKAIKEINARGKIPIICGGTGLYVDALLYDWDIPKVAAKPKLRNKLEKKSKEELFNMLSGLDPERAKIIDKNNKIRLVRAIEIVITTGTPVQKFELFKEKDSSYDFVKIGIKISDKGLKEKIHRRLLKRLKRGMIKEVGRLHGQGVSWKRLDNFGLEYRYVSRYLRGLITKEEMIKTIEKEHWHYVKRQMTWFKRDKNTIWINGPQKAFVIVRGFLGRGARL